jgi:hypothetical protein
MEMKVYALNAISPKHNIRSKTSFRYLQLSFMFQQNKAKFFTTHKIQIERKHETMKIALYEVMKKS